VGGLWATKSECVVLIVRAIRFQDFPPINPPTLQTGGQTDDMRSQNRALHYSASRSKNCWSLFYFHTKHRNDWI